MGLELEVFISILKSTRKGPTSHEAVNKAVRAPVSSVKQLLQRMQNEGLVIVRGTMIEASDAQRLRLAVQALNMGADLERVSSLLQWKEFEGMAAVAFEHNGYSVMKNLRFKHGGRRWEIDIVGCRRPLVVCADCKHWHHGLRHSALKMIVKEQVERVRALTRSLPNPAIKFEHVSWSSAKFVPMVLSLTVDRSKFYGGVPVVPILQLQDFLNQLPIHSGSLLCLTSKETRDPASGQKCLF